MRTTMRVTALVLSGSMAACVHLGTYHVPPVMPPPPASEPAVTVAIDSARPWTSTGLVVHRGDRLIIRAEGDLHWVARGEHTNPDGRNWSSFSVGAGGLIGRIDEGKAFDVGARSHLFPDQHPRPPHIPFIPPPLKMKKDGVLVLGIKKWAAGKFNGHFTVRIWRTS